MMRARLLIVEYMNPQLATEADAKFTTHLAQDPGDPPIMYRRIGNYSVFVFDATDQGAATGLTEQVKYEKSVQWLGKDPFLLEKFERYFAVTGRDVALATVRLDSERFCFRDFVRGDHGLCLFPIPGKGPCDAAYLF
jgi:hypothetical protein